MSKHQWQTPLEKRAHISAHVSQGFHELLKQYAKAESERLGVPVSMGVILETLAKEAEPVLRKR